MFSFTKVSQKRGQEEVVKTSNAIYHEITGKYPVYIRPPFGNGERGWTLQ